MVPLPASRFGEPGGGAAAARGCNGHRSLGSPRPGRSHRGEAGMQDPARREEEEGSLSPTRAVLGRRIPVPQVSPNPGGGGRAGAPLQSASISGAAPLVPLLPSNPRNAPGGRRASRPRARYLPSASVSAPRGGRDRTSPGCVRGSRGPRNPLSGRR